MIRFVRGELAACGVDHAVVDVGGVGMLLSISAQTLGRLPEVGHQVRLSAYLVVRDDALDLYGFADEDEREIFTAFIGVSGVGPRLGLALCGLDTPDALRTAVATGDVRRLQQTPGVGKRTAERIVVELRDRIARTAVSSGGPTPVIAGGGAGGVVADAREGLIGLGFTPDEAAYAIADAPDDLDAAGLVRHGLSRLKRR